MDYGRYRYEQTKKKQEAKKKQSTFQVKEIKVRPKTGEHDLQTKIGHIKKFLERKDKVKVTMIFRGREITLSQMGMSLLEKIAEETEELAVMEQNPKLEGRSLVMILAAKYGVSFENKSETPCILNLLKAPTKNLPYRLDFDFGVGRLLTAHAIYFCKIKAVRSTGF